jgi:hypothetical protein
VLAQEEAVHLTGWELAVAAGVISSHRRHAGHLVRLLQAIVVGIALLTAVVFSFVLAARGDDIPNVLVGLAAGSLVVLAVLAVNEIILEWRNRAERLALAGPGRAERAAFRADEAHPVVHRGQRRL